jgi:hypothetical protein
MLLVLLSCCTIIQDHVLADGIMQRRQLPRLPSW